MPDLTVAMRVLAQNTEVLNGVEHGAARLLRPLRAAANWLRRNTRAGSKRNISAHYDLSNDFFALMLDPTMTYSSGIFPSRESTLEEASIEKYDRVCRKLQLSRSDHVIEIGTGWGGFAWHERPGALDRLIPPWETVSVLKRGDGIRDGCVVELAQQLGPLRLRWIAKHHGYEAGQAFRDTQVSGPFAAWEHLHQFQPNGDGNGVLTDHIEYQVPGGLSGRLLGRALIQQKVATMFNYRHNTTQDDLAIHAKYKDVGTMHIAVTGATGLVGSTLVPLLTTGGHRVTKLVRRDAGEGEVIWNPDSTFGASSLDGIDATVHLAGENIAASRWSPNVKERIRMSRVQGTRNLCESIAKMKLPPKVLICASAIGFYGDRCNEELTEESAAGSGFPAEVTQEWEAATQPARDAGIRVVNLRFGVILSPKGGALAKMLLPFKLGGGGRVGSGKQYWSWISIDDAAGAIHHALVTDSLWGPVNAVAPNPVTNAAFTKTLGRVLRRPTVVPIPAFVARLALGEMADALLLASTRVVPKELTRTGYAFRQSTLDSALRHLLGRAERTIAT